MCVNADSKSPGRHRQALSRHKANRLVTGVLKLCSVVEDLKTLQLLAFARNKFMKAACTVTSKERSHCKGASPERPGQKQGAQ